jgi:hypothetical protein
MLLAPELVPDLVHPIHLEGLHTEPLGLDLEHRRLGGLAATRIDALRSRAGQIRSQVESYATLERIAIGNSS